MAESPSLLQALKRGTEQLLQVSSDTIFALATPPGRSAVAVIRISGRQAADACERLTRRPPPVARRAALRPLIDPERQTPIDEGLVLFFPAPASATGEDVLELHAHGGPAVVRVLTEALSELPGLRPAEPGEFTRRAFANGRIGLTEVEGLADVVEAETRLQLEQAQRQLRGDLGRLYEEWRGRLLRARAHLEAEIDFAAEEGVPEDLLRALWPDLHALACGMRAHLEDERRGERLRQGVAVAVVGLPNVESRASSTSWRGATSRS